MLGSRVGPRQMSAERCEKCELLIDAGCACTLTSTPARVEYVSTYRWIRFGPDTLLISSRNMAHIPGACTNVTEEYVLDPWLGLDPQSGSRRLGSHQHQHSSQGHPGRHLQGSHNPLLKLHCHPPELIPMAFWAGVRGQERQFDGDK
jgi:hypothetical protein